MTHIRLQIVQAEVQTFVLGVVLMILCQTFWTTHALLYGAVLAGDFDYTERLAVVLIVIDPAEPRDFSVVQNATLGWGISARTVARAMRAAAEVVAIAADGEQNTNAMGSEDDAALQDAAEERLRAEFAVPAERPAADPGRYQKALARVGKPDFSLLSLQAIVTNGSLPCTGRDARGGYCKEMRSVTGDVSPYCPKCGTATSKRHRVCAKAYADWYKAPHTAAGVVQRMHVLWQLAEDLDYLESDR